MCSDNRGTRIYKEHKHSTRRIDLAPDGSPSDQGAGQPMMSPDGRYIVFGSTATNVFPGLVQRTTPTHTVGPNGEDGGVQDLPKPELFWL